MTRGLATRDLRLRYPAQSTWAIDGVTLDIAPGEITWLTGALASGTSTLLMALAGLAPRLTGGEREGDVLLDGLDPATLAPLRHGIAYLGPTPALQLSGIGRTVRDEIAIGPMNLGWPAVEIAAAVDAILAQLALGPLADRSPRTLSGGELQRVLLAALAVTRPRCWLLDEPFSALDAPARVQVSSWLRQLAGPECVIVVACDEADTMRGLADRIVVLRHGTVALDGSPDAILADSRLRATGAATTDAAILAEEAGIAPPYPLDTATLMQRTGLPAPEWPVEQRTPPRVAASPVLRLDEVHFGYRGGPTVLQEISLSIGSGEGVGLFGRNGAGKSTLLRLAMALDHPSRGAVAVLGDNTSGRHPEDLAPAVGFLFQQPERQLFAASVRAECAVGPRLAGWESPRVDAAVRAVLDELGLADVADEHPYDLPLPRRRLVALAAVLTTDPLLLLLDEPTAAVDGASRERIAAVVRARVARGRTVLAVTHDPVFAHEALDRGLVLGEGRLLDDAPLREVFRVGRLARPPALEVAGALGLRAGEDRRAAVAGALRSRVRG
jgi:energy-coupling factor transport system ATP-binding protein